ncbi:MAG TPA: DUF4166 domain-containing protein [Burkholderiaceae bacterium]
MPGTPLYQTILGKDWGTLPAPIKAMHSCEEQLEAKGFAVIERGSGLLPWLTAKIFGFPAAGTNVPVGVTFRNERGGELWTRKFGNKSFSSFQSQGMGSSKGLLCERFGPLVFGLALFLREGRLNLEVRRWRFFGLPLPLVLAPSGDSYEHVEDGKFCFHVEIRHPLVGLIVRYRGWLLIC